MSALDRKLLRSLWHLRGQVIAVSMIIASGVGVMVMGLSSLAALEETTSAYYERYRFADVFANLTRAPESIASKLSSIPGVRSVDTRIYKYATVDIQDFEEPAIAQLVSLPERGEPLLNKLVLRAGRFVAADSPDEVVLNEPFSLAHNLYPGDNLHAIINGYRRKLSIVGIALSPEFVYTIGPGALMPDDSRFGLMWMGREAMAAAYDLDGAFNFVSMALLHGTKAEKVIEQVDQLLEPFGGNTAIARKDQLSNWFLMNELAQLRSFSTVLPSVFLMVAAFLTNMILARLIAIERGEIGLLKSFGFRNEQIAWHYTKLVVAMSMVGIVLGWLLGAGLGQYNTRTYADFFHFPILVFKPSPMIFFGAGLVSLIAALLGSLGAVRKAVRLPPAEAMRPPSPSNYGHGVLASSRFVAMLDQASRIIVRQLIRRPWRSAVTSLGVAFSVGIMVMSLQWIDSIEKMIDVQFNASQRQDATISLNQDQPLAVVHDVMHLPGVMAAEPMRIVSADFRAGSKVHRGAIQGVQSEASLQLVYDVSGKSVPVPDDGLVLGTELALKLGVRVGDVVWVDVNEGRRPTVSLPVVALVETYIDLPAYMNLYALNRILREPPSASAINVLLDASMQAAFYQQIKNTPQVAAVAFRQAAVDNFRDTMAETILIFVGFFGVFAAMLAFGVVYNSTRITLSERGRELASLRVLGFSRSSISYLLLGEVGILILIALPVGCLFGWSLAWFIVTTAFNNEMFRLPLFIHPSSYAIGIIVSLLAAFFSAALVRKRINQLDLIAVLKTRE